MFLKNTTPKDFYLKRKGPWPQPSPEHPWGEAPAVIKVPLLETLDWWIFIGSRYLATLALVPYYFLKGLIRPGLAPVNDERFEWYFNKTMLAKFICKNFDDKDRHIFGDILTDSPKWRIVDLEAAKAVKSKDGIYCSGSKTLLFEEDGIFRPKCVYLDESGEIFWPQDGEAWELAKYFVLQGAALCSTLVTHPNQHFPVDSINAITKTCLPKKHPLFALLYPHLRFTLPLENAVLNYKSSLLQDKWWMVYAPYPGDPDGLRDLLVHGYKGIKSNASYPPFSFPINGPDLETDYGVYLKTYYAVFLKFAAKVVSTIPSGEIWTQRWANYIAAHVPGFPNGDNIFEGNNLQRVIASYLFTVTVGHSVDHYNYGCLNKREIPLIIRQKPPGKGAKMRPRKELCSPVDLMKYYMADTLFYSPTTVTSLIKTNYRFSNPELSLAATEFKQDLRKAQSQLLAKGIRYMPLKDIAASIQF